MTSGEDEHDRPAGGPEAGADWPEPIQHSFIVKIWLEESRRPAGPGTWRGHVTHVPGSERCYFQDLDLSRITEFIADYLVIPAPENLGSVGD